MMRGSNWKNLQVIDREAYILRQIEETEGRCISHNQNGAATNDRHNCLMTMCDRGQWCRRVRNASHSLARKQPGRRSPTPPFVLCHTPMLLRLDEMAIAFDVVHEEFILLLTVPLSVLF